MCKVFVIKNKISVSDFGPNIEDTVLSVFTDFQVNNNLKLLMVHHLQLGVHLLFNFMNCDLKLYGLW